jgi:hypothetical protein
MIIILMVNQLYRSVGDAVGQAMGFEGGENGVNGGFICPIEEVLQTRWPTGIANWAGQPPPSID